MKKAQQIILLILFLSSCNENNNRPADLTKADEGTTGVYNTTEKKQDSEQVRELCMKLGNQALEHNLKGNVQQSIAADSQALVLAEKAGLQSEMIPIIKRLERKYAIQLKRTQSHQLIKKGQKIARELNDKRAEIDFHAATAMWYFYG
ncbi:MAG: hypothetical protein ACRC3B_11090, partial [Bacteroidia bacterium]